MVVLLVEVARQRRALCARHPQVRRAGVQDHLERLARGPDLDLREVLCVQVVGQGKVVRLLDVLEFLVHDGFDKGDVGCVHAAHKVLHVLALDGVDVVHERHVLQALLERVLVDLGVVHLGVCALQGRKHQDQRGQDRRFKVHGGRIGLGVGCGLLLLLLLPCCGAAVG